MHAIRRVIRRIWGRSNGNLCTEIIQYTDEEEVAVCNLASICLPKFVVSDRGKFGSVNPDSQGLLDHELHRAAKIVTRNLNKVIDVNDIPWKAPKVSTSIDRLERLDWLTHSFVLAAFYFSGRQGIERSYL
jgi:hypothetical protein